jgi:hypothetical protein
MPDLPWPGRHYHRRYGYPVRWAILAELAWRLEHWPLGTIAGRAYGWRKAMERRGAGQP